MSTTDNVTPPAKQEKANPLMQALQGLSSVFHLDGLFDGLGDIFGDGVEVTIPSVTKTLDVDVADDIALEAKGHGATIAAHVVSKTVVKASSSTGGGLLKKLFPPKDPSAAKE